MSTTTSTINLKTAPAHEVLAQAGKTVLRPGGVEATRQLLDWADFQPGETVLELAASFGNSAIWLAKRYGVNVVGIERNPDSVRIAQDNIRQAGLERQVDIREGNILKLSEVTETFDYVFAEAILTMQSLSGKQKILEGIQHVLKPHGKFLSHEMMATGDLDSLYHALSQSIRVNSQPLPKDRWKQLFEEAGLTVKQVKTGEMALLKPKRVIEDEGLLPSLKIAWNVLTQPQLRQRVFQIKNTFDQYHDQLNYIAVSASKEG